MKAIVATIAGRAVLSVFVGEGKELWQDAQLEAVFKYLAKGV